MRTSQKRPRLRQLVGTGLRLLRRYTGLLALLYLVQAGAAALAAWVGARALATTFASHPSFDAAADGDVITLMAALRDHPAAFSSGIWAGGVAVLVYALISWLSIAGLIGVFLHHPHGRRETAERFGQSGAGNVLPFARLALWSIIPWSVVGASIAVAVYIAAPLSARALTLTGAILPYAVALIPSAFLMLWLTTVVAYARIDLVRHRELASWRALWRALLLVTPRPRCLVHAALYPVAFAAITAVYLWVTSDHPAAGAIGGVSILILQQSVAALRMAAKVAILGGQTELAQELVYPPLQR